MPIIKYDHSIIKPDDIKDIVIHREKVIVTLYAHEPIIYRKEDNGLLDKKEN